MRHGPCSCLARALAGAASAPRQRLPGRSASRETEPDRGPAGRRPDRRLASIEWVPAVRPFFGRQRECPKGARGPARCLMTTFWRGGWRDSARRQYVPSTTEIRQRPKPRHYDDVLRAFRDDVRNIAGPSAFAQSSYTTHDHATDSSKLSGQGSSGIVRFTQCASPPSTKSRQRVALTIASPPKPLSMKEVITKS